MNLTKKAIELAKTLEDYKAQNVVVLDLTKKNIFTDYFIIVTSSSETHADGLEKRVYEQAKKLDLAEIKKIKKTNDGSEWKLIDFGDIIVHIMTPIARSFYELEKLWYDAEYIYGTR